MDDDSRQLELRPVDQTGDISTASVTQSKAEADNLPAWAAGFAIGDEIEWTGGEFDGVQSATIIGFSDSDLHDRNYPVIEVGRADRPSNAKSLLRKENLATKPNGEAEVESFANYCPRCGESLDQERVHPYYDTLYKQQRAILDCAECGFGVELSPEEWLGDSPV
jgi:hypothetical protein